MTNQVANSELSEQKPEEKETINCNDQQDIFHISDLEKLEKSGFRSKILSKPQDKSEELPEKFKEILLEKEIKEFKSDLPYIVGYKGFRRGVKSGNYYGQNFIDTSLNSKKDILNRNK